MLTFTIPKWTVELVLSSDLGDQPHGYAMHQACLNPIAIKYPGRALESYRLRAPVDSWETLALWLKRKAYTEHGTFTIERAEAKKRFTQSHRIMREIDKLAGHPAYRGIAVAGVSTVVLPAHRIEHDTRWWPTRRRAAEQSIKLDSTVMVSGKLVPVLTNRGARQYTQWVFHKTIDYQTFDAAQI